MIKILLRQRSVCHNQPIPCLFITTSLIIFLKDLNIQIERITKKVVKMKEDVEREVTDTQAAQTELDKTADDFM